MSSYGLYLLCLIHFLDLICNQEGLKVLANTSPIVKEFNNIILIKYINMHRSNKNMYFDFQIGMLLVLITHDIGLFIPINYQ